MIRYFTASDGAKDHLSDRRRLSGLVMTCRADPVGTDFEYVLPNMTGVTAIRMDYRGRGDSEWTGEATYTIQRESLDALELLDHLGFARAAILGTSLGGIIAMGLAAVAHDRLIGVMLNDIGPVLEPGGLKYIQGHIGRNPDEQTFEAAAALRASQNEGFVKVPPERWAAEVRKYYTQTPDGLKIVYDPALADAVVDVLAEPHVDLWPIFDALAGLPLATLKGENSGLLSASTFAKMRRRPPDMIAAEVPDRGNIPFF